MFPDLHFVAETRHFQSGDPLLLTSDGFIETRDAAGSELAVEGLEALVRWHSRIPTEAMTGRRVAATRAFGPVIGDLTLVVVRRR